MVEDIKKIKDVDNKLVSKYINDSFDKNKICVVLNDVKYLVKGGRLNSLKGFLATMLKFKVIVELSNSGVQLVGKTNKINAIGDIVDPLLSKTIKYNGNNINKLCIFTSGIDGGKFNVDEIKNIIIKHFSFKDVTFAELPSVIAVHVGPNYIGIAMQTK
jgi:fatty acid-binding protein DegV